MYIFLLIAFVGASTLLLVQGLLKRNSAQITGGVISLGAAVLFFPFLTFWGEMLWFDALGHSARFWRVVGAKAGASIVAGAVGFAAIYLLSRPALTLTKAHCLGAALVGSLVTGYLGYESWDEVLLYLNRVSTGLSDPILGRDTGFYLFILPLYDRVYWILFCIASAGLLAIVALPYLPLSREHQPPESPIRALILAARPLTFATAFLAVVLAWGKVLSVYHLLYSEWGVVAGPGWTDARVRLPALWLTAAVTLVLGIRPAAHALRHRLARKKQTAHKSPANLLVTSWIGIGAVWLLALALIPALLQWLVVEPNEISFERPYIAHNIEFTRHGFRLDEVEDRQFPATELLTSKTLEENEHLLSEIRLWDWRALDAVYKQFQEIRLYFEFYDVDMDRYTFDNAYRQVMISARELNQANLPRQSSTFVNKRFKYTHGYGLAMSTVSDFTQNGLPNLLVKDIPPKTDIAELEVARPQIYYGELTTGTAVVKTKEKEFDHPSGDENVYITYDGTGGVRLNNLWRKFVYGWMFDGTRFFFSTYMTPETRVLFHRQLRERVSTLAPFLEFDADPYLVLVEGRLHWIIDAYTTSSYYPYSEPLTEPGAASYLQGVNYVRNSVKATVDAFDGTVRFYVYEPGDPLLRAWRSAFPELFHGREEMPEALQAHVRYPEDFLLAQGLVYAKYHMTDADVFYNQEDLWVRATEKYYDKIRELDPYYVMWQLPGKKQAEFVLMLPFTPKNRQVLIGWIAGMCDQDNYGRFLAYKFPKEKRVLGPQQVETKIDQDRFLSGQLTLWDQRGSKVIRGNVLAIPIEETLLYVEPIYLQAETAAYPELRLVVVMHGDTMSYGETFEAALEGLIERPAAIVEELEVSAEMTAQELAVGANAAFEKYLEHLGSQRFEEASVELRRLQEILHQMLAREVD